MKRVIILFVAYFSLDILQATPDILKWHDMALRTGTSNCSMNILVPTNNTPQPNISSTTVTPRKHGRHVLRNANEHHNRKHQVYIIQDNEFLCPGTVISESWVLTSAACFPTLFEAGTGSTKIFESWKVVIKANKSRPAGDKYQVKKIILHYRFNESKPTENDLALVELDEELKLAPTIALVRSLEDITFRGSDILHTFTWRNLEGTDKWSLFEVHLVPITHEQCAKQLPNHMTQLTFNVACAKTEERACANVEGGAVTFNNKLLGIVMGIGFHEGERVCPEPLVYTNVVGFRAWIKDVLSGHPPKRRHSFFRSQGEE